MESVAEAAPAADGARPGFAKLAVPVAAHAHASARVALSRP